MFCPECGKQLLDDSVFCEYCGSRVTEGFGALPKRSVLVDTEQIYPVQDKNSALRALIITGAIILSAVLCVLLFLVP